MGLDRGGRVAYRMAYVHAICEEYRAAATIDQEHDLADRNWGRRIDCPVLVLWSGRGPLNSWYASEGGPLGLWRTWARDVQGNAVDAGHFFPEELPEQAVPPRLDAQRHASRITTRISRLAEMTFHSSRGLRS